MNFTLEQITALAPDASSITAAKKLLSPSKWPLLGHSENAIWGHCKGSGKNPYEVRIDIHGPAFKCSCPSRKFPCKHGLALFMLYVESTDAFTGAQTPDWVQDWLDKRKQREQSRTIRAEKKAAAPLDPEAEARKQAIRIQTITQGLDDCERFLNDLVANGLASVQSQGYALWDNAAARLVDAKAPGAAAFIKRMAQIAVSGSATWLDDLTLLIGRLYLLIKSFKRYQDLTEQQQADLRTVVGWPFEKDSVLNRTDSINGVWSVVGESIRDDGRVKEQRLWLRDTHTQSMAMILSFAYGNQPLDISLIPGTCLEAELTYYPGSFPLRALIKNRLSDPRPIEVMAGEQTIALALEKYANAVTYNPWTTMFPLVMANLLPYIKDNQLYFIDIEGRRIQPHPAFKEKWECIALSGGKRMTICGEWIDRTLIPLSCWNEEGFFLFTSETAA